MNSKVQSAYNRVIEQIADLGATFKDPADYREFIEEIEGHVKCLRMGIDEEEQDKG